jgi:hypothetical protein
LRAGAGGEQPNSSEEERSKLFHAPKVLAASANDCMNNTLVSFFNRFRERKLLVSGRISGTLSVSPLGFGTRWIPS